MSRITMMRVATVRGLLFGCLKTEVRAQSAKSASLQTRAFENADQRKSLIKLSQSLSDCG